MSQFPKIEYTQRFSNVKKLSAQKSVLTRKSKIINEVKFSSVISVALLCCNSFEISKQRIKIARVRQGDAKSDNVCQHLTAFRQVKQYLSAFKRFAKLDIVRQKNIDFV